MKLKYYWLQFIPLIGIIYVLTRSNYIWSDYFSPYKQYFGNSNDFILSVFIQAVTVFIILNYFI